jgi:hypothetical protein
MIETVALFALAFAAFLLAARLFARPRAARAASRPSPLDVWATHETARLAAEKLGLEETAILRALERDPDPEIVAGLERGTRKIELCIERVPGALGGDAADVTLELSFEDGSVARARRRAPWSELDPGVAAELSRTGSARVYRARPFPWQR